MKEIANYKKSIDSGSFIDQFGQKAEQVYLSVSDRVITLQ